VLSLSQCSLLTLSPSALSLSLCFLSVHSLTLSVAFTLHSAHPLSQSDLSCCDNYSTAGTTIFNTESTASQHQLSSTSLHRSIGGLSLAKFSARRKLVKSFMKMRRSRLCLRSDKG
jgi:hypothetical protein